MERCRAIWTGVSWALAGGSLLVSSISSAGDAIVALASGSSAGPQVSAPAGCVPAWVVDASGIRRLPDRCPDALGEQGSTAASRGVAPDRAGAARGAVERQPRVTGARSTAARRLPRRAAPPVNERTTRADCDSKYWVDAQGVRRLRPQCL